MIDLHCHLLWDMDDGAESMEKTIALCRSAVKNGIRIIAATPHLTDLELIEDFLYERNQRIAELNGYLEMEKMPLKVCGGAEVYLDHHIFEADSLDEVTINRSKYLLCEYSLQPFQPERAALFAEEVFERGCTPIIAHPERYPTFHRYPSIPRELRDMGALLQVNADSLAGLLGKEIQTFAKKLLLDGTAELIATDAHDPQFRGNAIERLKKQFPPEISKELIYWATWIAPQYVLRNADLPERPQGI